METLILAACLMIGTQDDILAKIIKARIEILRKTETPEPPLAKPIQAPLTYNDLRDAAIKQKKPLILFVGEKNWMECDEYYLIFNCDKFPDPKNPKKLLTDAIIVSKPERDQLWYVSTLRGPATWPMIDKALCPDGKCVPPKR